MASHNEFGKRGETIACTHLQKMGYKVLEKNWHFGHEEIDIIAELPDFIVFVEVKARSSISYGEPEFFVSKTKQRHIIRAANAYLEQHNLDKEARFDIIGILHSKGNPPKINHIPDAYYPTL